MDKKILAVLGVGAVVLVVALLGGEDSRNSGGDSRHAGIGGTSSQGIPDPYYLKQKTADTNSITEIIRFADSIRGYGQGMTIWQRAAFYEWYFKNHGFNISFAYAQRFPDTGQPHLWLLVKTRKGERIELEPSPSDMGASCMEPLEPRYNQFDKEYADIFELARDQGTDRIAWWKSGQGQQVLEENVLLGSKEEVLERG